MMNTNPCHKYGNIELVSVIEEYCCFNIKY